MNRCSAPGPDGFGTGFYAAAWQTIQSEVLAFLDGFHSEDIDLQRINRSYMVLLPKKPGAVAVDCFRPICLQNCSVKIAVKILTTRLQREIAELVALEQTGFVKGRSIAENFVHAAELVQVCHKRKAPTLVLKLDFAKAFDTVNWRFLLSLLQHLGFSRRWLDWISLILSSASTKIILNGSPGRRICHARGLRQGDPLSPLLFVLVMEVLNALLKLANERGLLQTLHPMIKERAFMYVDDVVIFLSPVQ